VWATMNWPLARRRRVGSIVFVAFGAIAFSACSSAPSGTGTTNPSNPVGSPSAQAPVTTTSSPAEPLSFVTSASLASSAGYTATAVLRRGAFEPASTNLQNGSLALGAVCSASLEGAAAEPFQLSLTNTSSGFTSTMSFGGNLMGPNTAYNHGYPGTVAVEETSSSGPVCENGASGGQSASGFVLQGSVAPGQTASTDGFIILYGYYSPANPSGDRSLVNGPYFQLLASLDTTGGQAAFSNTRGIVAGPTGVTPLLAMPLNPEVTTCGVSTNPNLTQNGEPFVCPSS
jgi:hypothetical protein